ncbi:MAG: 5'-methylthioadenosine/adenosylhomocysteine nucleosidase, partial [Spirochaetaceae bacterium]|nr:5'-methylthioadenosine/adenosylhomocysteine nucleosidase [Spirochaetaceae bacterium]
IKEICNPYCVEMEGAAIAQTCWLFSVPFVIIRCISDMAENTDEVYEEEKAAAISGFLVENMITLID